MYGESRLPNKESHIWTWVDLTNQVFSSDYENVCMLNGCPDRPFSCRWGGRQWLCFDMHEKRIFPQAYHSCKPHQPWSTPHLHPPTSVYSFHPLAKKDYNIFKIAKYILRDVICQHSTCVITRDKCKHLTQGREKGWLWAVVASTAKHWPTQQRAPREMMRCHLRRLWHTAKIIACIWVSGPRCF